MNIDKYIPVSKECCDILIAQIESYMHTSDNVIELLECKIERLENMRALDRQLSTICDDRVSYLERALDVTIITFGIIGGIILSSVLVLWALQ